MSLRIFEQLTWILSRDVCARRGDLRVSGGAIGTPNIGDYGTYARIIDWDQLPNGLLGIVIEGQERFDVQSVWREPDGLITAEVLMSARPDPVPIPDEFEGLSEVLTGLLRHPQIQRLQLDHDPGNAWSVGAQLAQLLPIDEAIKYSLQGLETAEQMLEEMDKIWTELSGEPGS